MGVAPSKIVLPIVAVTLIASVILDLQEAFLGMGLLDNTTVLAQQRIVQRILLEHLAYATKVIQGLYISMAVVNRGKVPVPRFRAQLMPILTLHVNVSLDLPEYLHGIRVLNLMMVHAQRYSVLLMPTLLRIQLVSVWMGLVQV
jgi:hypothetical protein